MLHHITSNDTFKFKHTLIPAVRPKPTWHGSIYSININTSAEPFAIIRTPSNDTFKFKHVSIPTDVLPLCTYPTRHRSYSRKICIQWKPTSAQARAPCAIGVVVCLNSRRFSNSDDVMAYRNRNQVMTHSNSNIHEYQRTFCSIKANTFHIFSRIGTESHAIAIVVK